MKIFNYIFILISFIICLCILLIVTSLIPRRLIEKNVFNSAIKLFEESDYIEKDYSFIKCMNDNYADAVMINNCYSLDSNVPIYSALMVRRNYNAETNEMTLKEEIGNPVGGMYETEELLKTVLKLQKQSKVYAKYWHGYMIYLKPLLILFDYSQIRIIQLIVIITLMYIFIYLISKKIGLSEAIIFLIGFVITNVELVYSCLEFFPVFVIMFGVSIYLIKKYEKIKNIEKLFFISGILTCFFDFLTVPIITLGVPLIIYFLLKQKNNRLSLYEILEIFIKNCIIWAIGFGAMWFAKFILVDFLFDSDLINSGIAQIKFRTFSNPGISVIEFICDIKDSCIKNLFIVFLIYSSMVLIKKKAIVIDRNKIIIYLLISCLPIVWYCVLKEHSIQHRFFTYRATLVLWISLMLMIKSIIQDNK